MSEVRNEVEEHFMIDELGGEARPRSPGTTPMGWLIVVVFSVIFYFAFQAYFFRTFRIPSQSMFPSIQAGEFIFVNKFIYGVRIFDFEIYRGREPQAGEIVVFSVQGIDPRGQKRDLGKLFIKRVVARPGDVLEIKDDRVYIDGYQIYEKAYIHLSELERESRKAAANYGPIKLKSGEYFVLGDNRKNSQDSRIFGPVNLQQIKGRAELIYMSIDSNDDLRIDRLGRWVR